MKTKEAFLLVVVVGIFAVIFLKVHSLQDSLDDQISGQQKFTEDKVNDLRTSMKSTVSDSIEVVARSATPEKALPLKVRELLVQKVDNGGKTYREIEVGLDGFELANVSVKIPEGTLYWIANNGRSLVLLNHQMHVVYSLPGEGWRMVSDQAPVQVDVVKEIVDDKTLTKVLRDIK